MRCSAALPVLASLALSFSLVFLSLAGLAAFPGMDRLNPPAPPASLDSAQHFPGQAQAAGLLLAGVYLPCRVVYPFAAQDPVGPVGSKIDILDGSGATDFGWLAWNPDPESSSQEYLRDELQNPQLSWYGYINARDPGDSLLSVGDWVASLRGINGGIESVNSLLGNLVGQEMTVPVWDAFVDGSGSSPDAYHITSFISVRIESAADINLVAKTVYATYLGPVELGQCPALGLTKSGPDTALAGGLITYTLTLTNPTNLTATQLLLTDALPAGAAYVSGGTRAGSAISWSIPSLDPGASLSFTFTVTATQAITNDFYQVSANGQVIATGQTTVVTLIDDRVMYVPVVWK